MTRSAPLSRALAIARGLDAGRNSTERTVEQVDASRRDFPFVPAALDSIMIEVTQWGI